MVLVLVKNVPANAGGAGDLDSIGSGRSSGGGHGNPLQYSYLESPMDRGVWQATVHRVAESQTGPKLLAHMLVDAEMDTVILHDQRLYIV